MAQHLECPEMDQLFDAILSLENRTECYAFFKDCCTISELKAMAQRLEVAKLLNENMKYTEICEQTGASSATVSRVGRSLHYGEDGYAIALSRMNQQKEEKDN